MAWLERLGQFQNLWHLNLVNKQLQYTNILSNILRRKASQRIKFCQLTEYNMRNVFLGKSYTKHYTNRKFLKKRERGLKLVSLPHFLHDFRRKMFIYLFIYIFIWISVCILSTWRKHQVKDLNILITKRAFKMKQKAFFIICKWWESDLKFKTKVKSKVEKKWQKVVKLTSSIFINKYYESLDRKLLWRTK